MAQIIKHRRGSLESLSTVTGSLQKGEIVIASGSSNLTTTNGTSIVFAVPADGQVQATNRFLVGDSVPNTFAASTYNGMVKGVPYYASGSSTLYLLGSDGNDIINLEGNISNFSASVASAISSLSSSVGGGVEAVETRVAGLEALTGSYATTGSNTFVGNQTITGSINVKDSAATFSIVGNGFSETYLQSNGGMLLLAGGSGVQIKSNSLAVDNNLTVGGDISGSTINGLGNVTAFSTSVDSRFSASAASVSSLSASVASVTGDFSSSVATSFSASAASQLVLSSSIATDFSNVETAQGVQNDRLDAIEAETSSYARTDSDNNFTGTQTITGSLYITQDLVVYGSSSLFNVTASRLDIGDNTIILNTVTPAVRFGGISVADSGSGAGESGSLFWDSVNNHWLYQQAASAGEGYNSAILIAGPKNVGALGEEVGLTTGKITLAVGEDHIGDSIITQNGTGSISVAGNVIVTGSITVGTSQVALLGGDNLVTSSAQILLTEVDGYTTYSGSVSASLASIVANVGSGVGVSIDNLNSFTSSINTTIDTQLDSKGVISGSTQVLLTDADNTNFDTSYVSENANYLYYTDGRVKDKLDSESVISSSAQIGLTSADNTGFDTSYVSENASYLYYTDGRVKDKLDSESVISSSIQVTLADTYGYSDFSSSIATSFSGSNASITSLSASVASVTGDFSSSVATSFSASAASQNTLSSSLAGRVSTLEGTGTIQGLGTENNVTFAKVTTTGDVIVGGDLVVQGNTVTLNTATLIVEDKLITLASGSTSNATADGAGFEVAGTSASFKYDGTANQFSSSVDIVANVTGSINLGSAAGSSKRVAFRNANGNLDLVPTASVAGDLLQWDGTDFVMSNVIDGGSF